MIFLGKLIIGFLDIFLAGISGYSQYLVIIIFGQRSTSVEGGGTNEREEPLELFSTHGVRPLW